MTTKIQSMNIINFNFFSVKGIIAILCTMQEVAFGAPSLAPVHGMSSRALASLMSRKESTLSL